MNITASNYADELGYDNKVQVLFESNGKIKVEIDNTQLLIQLICVLLVIIVWHAYLSLYTTYEKRKKVLWVEVQDFLQPVFSVSRIQAKENLLLIDELTKRLKKYNSLFDKYWYQQREFQYIDGIQRAMFFLFSNELNVENVFGNTIEDNYNYIDNIENIVSYDHHSENALETNLDPKGAANWAKIAANYTHNSQLPVPVNLRPSNQSFTENSQSLKPVDTNASQATLNKAQSASPDVPKTAEPVKKQDIVGYF